MGTLTLKIVTPQGSQPPVACDSLRLTLCDGENGLGGGSYGIRSGHAKALLALAASGPVTALAAGKTVLAGRCGGGFASVEGDAVTVVTESFARETP